MNWESSLRRREVRSALPLRGRAEAGASGADAASRDLPTALPPSPSRGEGASTDSPSGRTRYSGFTLVEVLVTLGLLALVVTMVYGSLWSTVDGITRIEARSDREQAARILLEMMERELRSALLTADDPRLYFLGQDGTANDLPADRLTWVNAAHLKLHPALPETETAEVSYWLESDSEGHPILYRREDATRDGDPGEGGTTYRLSDALVGLDFQYYGPQGWVHEWDSRINNTLPRVVQISLFLPAESSDPEAPPVEIRSLVDIPLAW